MRFDRTGTVVVSEALMRLGFVFPEPGIPILMYHSISEDTESLVRPYYRLATSPSRFRTHMRWLKDNEYDVITLPEAVSRLASGMVGGRRYVVLTFDDGFREFQTLVWPILQTLRFSATVFLPTAFIGDTEGSFNGRTCLTWSEIRELHGSGVVFGSHTLTHPVLYGLDWPAIRAELAESKDALEYRIGGPVHAFAYPYAFPQEDVEFVDALREELSALDYRTGVTTMVGRATARDHPLTLRRIPVNDGDDESLFAAKLVGLYDWVAYVQKWRRAVLHTWRGTPRRLASHDA